MHETLSLRMAGYVLGLGQAIKDSDGRVALEAHIRSVAEKSGERKADDLASVPRTQQYQALAERLRNMLHDFGGTNIETSAKDCDSSVDNPACPCLSPFVDQARRFGFSRDEVHRFACMICMPSYAKAAQVLGVEFRGTLTERGCVMHFRQEMTPLTVSGEPVHFANA